MPRRRHSSATRGQQLGNVQPLLEDAPTARTAARTRQSSSDQPNEKHDREVLAAFCRAIDQRLNRSGPIARGERKNGAPPGRLRTMTAELDAEGTLIAGLSPRVSQTLEHLLAGDSEKQIAGKLQLSRHTVHVYVKSLYKTFDVNSRGELLARFVRR
jgi:DNA-binding CsgD family transcriptional regulator